jgi:hypothetical protein
MSGGAKRRPSSFGFKNGDSYKKQRFALLLDFRFGFVLNFK